MTEPLPFSQACENNKEPILQVLREWLDSPGLVLELGTGTGQHAVHFAAGLPHLEWQPSDRPEVIDNCRARIDNSGLGNLRPPVSLDVRQSPWPLKAADAVFSANTAHIMAWPEVESMFTGVSGLLSPGGLFCLYGPFHYHGEATSPSNAEFDAHLKAQGSGMGIRDMDELEPLARSNRLELAADIAMPANNRLLIWRRLP
ncbi:DUF938 domain-containing protein [Marinobacter salicampi]|uniref:DUF938 domain-containing protein n=1 Tax=Marinobacter salicampi TaxID=435907 RepID=UPI00140A651B|nr:DUF938 domain-containing protein [Marinobacter salicampi]